MPISNSGRPVINVRVLSRFPSRIVGATGIAVATAGGIATVKMNVPGLTENNSTTAGNRVMVSYDPASGEHEKIRLDAFEDFFGAQTVAAAQAFANAASNSANASATSATGAAGSAAAAATTLTNTVAAGVTAVTNVNTAGSTQVAAVAAQGVTSTALVTTEGNTQTQRVLDAATAKFYPTPAAALSQGIAQATLTGGGSGATTPGDYDVPATNGGGSNGVIRVRVAAGAITTILGVRNPGFNYTSNPSTWDFSAIAGLTGATISSTRQVNQLLGTFFLVSPGSAGALFDEYEVTAGPAATLRGSAANPDANILKEYYNRLVAAAGPGSIKASWHYKGNKTPFGSSPTILTSLKSLGPSPLSLDIAASGGIYAGVDGRPVYDDVRGIYMSSQAGMQLLATSVLGHTTGAFAIIYTCDLNTVTSTIGLEASLPASPSIVEGDMILVNADANTTFTPDVKTVLNSSFSDAQLKNGYFKGVGNTQTQYRGPYTLMKMWGATTYMTFELNHLGQLRGYLYSGAGGVVIGSLVIGIVPLGMTKFTVALRRHKGLMSIWFNGKQGETNSLLTQGDITDLTTLYINGSARTLNTVAPISQGLRQYFNDLTIADNIPDANWQELYNEVAAFNGTPLMKRARRARGFAMIGQSWTDGAISCAGDSNTNTVSGNLWNGQVTKNNVVSGEDTNPTRDWFPNWFASRSNDDQRVNNTLTDDISPISVTVSAGGNESFGHKPNATGENFIFGCATQMNLNSELAKDDWFVAGRGAGGASIAVLSAKSAAYSMDRLKTAPILGSDHYYRWLRQMIYHRDAAYARNQPYTVDVCVWQQGQTDSGLNTTYAADLTAFITMANADIKAITGQSFNPRWFAPQISYGYTPTQRCISNVLNCLDQIFLDLEDAGLLQCLGPMYQVTTHIHPPRLGHRLVGEIFGYNISRALDGDPVTCLRPITFGSTLGATAIPLDYRIRDGRALKFVDQNDNSIYQRRTINGVDTYGFEFFRKVLGAPNYGVPANAVTISASTGIVTCTGHGLIAGDKGVLASAGVLPTGYVNGTEYFVINPTATTFGLSATLGGAQIVVSGSASGTHAILDTTVKIASVVIPSSVVTISIANPGVINWTAHGLAVGNKVRFTTTGALPTGLLPNTDYWIATVPNANSFTVQTALNITGSIVTTGTQSGTHTCTSANRLYVNLDTALAGAAGSRGVLKYLGEFDSTGNLCDGDKINGVHPYEDWAGAVWASNEPAFLPGPVDDVRQWAAGFTKAL